MYAGWKVSKDASAGALGVLGNVKVVGCFPAPRTITGVKHLIEPYRVAAQIKANCPLEHRTRCKPYRTVSITSKRHPGLKFRWWQEPPCPSLTHPEFRNKRKSHHGL